MFGCPCTSRVAGQVAPSYPPRKSVTEQKTTKIVQSHLSSTDLQSALTSFNAASDNFECINDIPSKPLSPENASIANYFETLLAKEDTFIKQKRHVVSALKSFNAAPDNFECINDIPSKPLSPENASIVNYFETLLAKEDTFIKQKRHVVFALTEKEKQHVTYYQQKLGDRLLASTNPEIVRQELDICQQILPLPKPFQ